MFDLVGFIISIFIMCVIVMAVLQLVKKLSFVQSIAKWFDGKIKRISFYQVLSFIIAIVALIVAGWFAAIEPLTTIQLLLNALLITFSANGVYTWYVKLLNIVKTVVK